MQIQPLKSATQIINFGAMRRRRALNVDHLKPSMSFDQRKFLDKHIRYRLTTLEVFHYALQIISTDPKPDSRVRMVFDTGHTLNGSYGIFTNPAVEAGLVACRILLEFLEAKQSNHDDDVFITMFQRPTGENLSPVPLSVVAGFPPPEVSQDETLEALKFTKKTADKAVAHLTLGPPDRGGKEIQLYQISCLAIRAAIRTPSLRKPWLASSHEGI